MKSLRPIVVGLSALLAVSACSISPEVDHVTSGTGNASGAAPAAQETPTPTPTHKEYPLGGRSLFPAYRLMGYSGVIGTGPGLGRAGVGNIDDRMKEIVERGKPYTTDGRKIMPTLEMIATVVQPCSGSEKCRSRPSPESVQKHLDAVRKVNGMLLIGVQPGRSDFLTEVKYYEKFLKEPDVGIAMDPEWRMGPDQEPMKSFGSTDSKELNQVGEYLSKIVADNDLPEKPMLYHMIRTNWVRQPKELKQYPGVPTIVSVDGIGSQQMKTETWTAIMGVKPPFVHTGFKMFYDEDTRGAWKLMTPTQVLALKPTPDYVLYE